MGKPMLRLTAIFIAVCVVLIAGSLGAVVYLVLGLSAAESSIVALAALATLTIYNTVSTRVRDRTDVGDQIADLSRGTADLARQVGELGRKLAAFENGVGDLDRRVKNMTSPLSVEIGELGTLVKNLAETVGAHEARIETLASAPPPVIEAPAASKAVSSDDAPMGADTRIENKTENNIENKIADAPPPAADTADSGPFKGKSNEEIVAIIREAIDANRVDLYLQPILTLPQRKVRYYESMTRLRLADGTLILPADFIKHAENAGLMPKVDNLMLFLCVKVLRRLLVKNREIGLFCNISMSTLNDPEFFPQFSQFMEANRALAPSLMLELPQEAWRTMGPMEHESLSAFAERGFRFSMDQVSDLRMEPKDLSDRGIRFVKIQAALLLNKAAAPADIHAGDLSDLLGRFGISLVAERIETEAVVVDLLDYDVRFGQGFLFSHPRPVRAEALQGVGERDVIIRDTATNGIAASRPAGAPVRAVS
jgi:cyclic-di-GMP phosphodiesterase TipF (flagellum assembly factor)